MTAAGQAGAVSFRFELNLSTGVPAYRQIIDQVTAGMATGALQPGNRLPTVRQLAVDLAVNPNTVARAYRELEIRGLLETQQGTGTFVGRQKVMDGQEERQRRLDRLVGEFVARAGAGGFTVLEVIQQLKDVDSDRPGKARRER
jgi:GntR family transcriptional regulator